MEEPQAVDVKLIVHCSISQAYELSCTGTPADQKSSNEHQARDGLVRLHDGKAVSHSPPVATPLLDVVAMAVDRYL